MNAKVERFTPQNAAHAALQAVGDSRIGMIFRAGRPVFFAKVGTRQVEAHCVVVVKNRLAAYDAQIARIHDDIDSDRGL
jgi:hypothetical protein